VPGARREKVLGQGLSSVEGRRGLAWCVETNGKDTVGGWFGRRAILFTAAGQAPKNGARVGIGKEDRLRSPETRCLTLRGESKREEDERYRDQEEGKIAHRQADQSQTAKFLFARSL